ncbi:MAG: HXXEE domain-containing protein [Trueperaceae bacterium]|nr:HXXEE domain-containing protein [Trueperaceae bacterium]
MTPEPRTPDEHAIPTVTPNALAWLDSNWPFAGTVAAAFLACLLPLAVGAWPSGLTLTYLLLLLYLVHQVEEHYRDRFRRFINLRVAGGADALTPRATMWINVGAVWLLGAVVLLLTGLVDVGFGLILIYTTLLNAVLHIVMAAVLRSYNPGLLTAAALFVPFGTWALVVVARANGLGLAGHLVGLAVAVLAHAAIVVLVRRRVGRSGDAAAVVRP